MPPVAKCRCLVSAGAPAPHQVFKHRYFQTISDMQQGAGSARAFGTFNNSVANTTPVNRETIGR
jgi:hypothetical protein